MIHLITLVQVIYLIVVDCILFLFYFKWNMYLTNSNKQFKKKNGIVSYINNYERNNTSIKYMSNKYKAAFYFNNN
jgi:hypothetical protein